MTGVVIANCNADGGLAGADPAMAHTEVGSELGHHSFVGRQHNSSNGGSHGASDRKELHTGQAPLFAKLFSCFRPAVPRYESSGGAMIAM